MHSQDTKSGICAGSTLFFGSYTADEKINFGCFVLLNNFSTKVILKSTRVRPLKVESCFEDGFAAFCSCGRPK